MMANYLGGDMVKTMSVRGLDDTLAEKLKQAAKKDGKSVNQFMIDSIRKTLSEEKVKHFNVIRHDMGHLFGKWSEEEFDRLQGKINSESIGLVCTKKTGR